MASMANEQKVPGDIRLHLSGMDPLVFAVEYQEGEKGGSILMVAQNELTKDKFQTIITENSLRKIGVHRKCRLVLKMLLVALQFQKPDEFTVTIGYLDSQNMPGDEEAELAPPNRAVLRAMGNGQPLVLIVERVTDLDEVTLWFIMDPVEQDKADRLEAMVRDRQREVVALQEQLAQAQDVISTLQSKMATLKTETESKIKTLTERLPTPLMGVWTSSETGRNVNVKWDTNVMMLGGERKDFLQVSADNSRFTSPAGGVYDIDVGISCHSGSNGNDYVALKIGGSIVSTRYSYAANGGQNTQFHLRDVVRLTAGQYFEIHYQNGGYTMNNVGSGAQHHKLIVTKLSN